MSDPRLTWLLQSPLAGLLQATGASGAGGYVAEDPAVRAWLEDKNGGNEVRLLSAYVLAGEKRIRFTNEIGALSSGQQQIDQELHLIKLDTGGANAEEKDFSKQVLITNTVGDAVQGLYQLIHSVFAPKLLAARIPSCRRRSSQIWFRWSRSCTSCHWSAVLREARRVKPTPLTSIPSLMRLIIGLDFRLPVDTMASVHVSSMRSWQQMSSISERNGISVL